MSICLCIYWILIMAMMSQAHIQQHMRHKMYRCLMVSVDFGLMNLLRVVAWGGNTGDTIIGALGLVRGFTVVHDDVIKWKHFPRYWPFLRGSHRSPMNFPHKGQWRRALMFSLICLNKRLSEQSWGWWFETPSRPLWRHCNGYRV